jgi:hypothetical protein
MRESCPGWDGTPANENEPSAAVVASPPLW